MEREYNSSPTDLHNNSPWQSNKVEVWNSLFEGSPTKAFKKNTVIYNQGDSLQFVYFILKGRVRASLVDEDGSEKTVIIFTEGTIFGEIAAIEQAPSLLTTITNTTCTLAYMSHTQFLDNLLQNPKLSQQLTLSLTQKIRSLTYHIKDISFLNSYERVIAYLLKLANTFGKSTTLGIKISIQFTHQEMADLIGTSRVTVSKIMSLLDKDGIIEKVNGYVYIKNKEYLSNWLGKNR